MGYETERVLDSLAWAQHFARSCTANLPSHLDRDDLQSAGVLGYLRAAERFDANRGASFRGYCAVRIRGAVLDELRRWELGAAIHPKKYSTPNAYHIGSQR